MSVIRVCFIGDSVTLGTGDITAQGWPGRLSALEGQKYGHDISCYNLGIRAETSNQIRARWMQESELRLPEHVNGRFIFMFGLNDMAIDHTNNIRVSLDQSVNNARAMMTSAKSWKPTLWLGPTPVRGDNPVINPGKSITFAFDTERTKTLNNAYRELATELNIPYLDMHEAFESTAGWQQTLDEGDGVHPTGDGYQLIAKALTNWKAWRNWLSS